MSRKNKLKRYKRQAEACHYMYITRYNFWRLSNKGDDLTNNKRMYRELKEFTNLCGFYLSKYQKYKAKEL